MTVYKYFRDALRDYRSCGGAMLFASAERNWTVCTFAAIAKRTTLPPREATRVALLAGGFTDEQVAAELGDWI